MFFNSFKNLFNDMYFERAGFDINKMKLERKEKEEIEKRDTIIFSNKNKYIISSFGVFFFAVAILCISSGITNKNYIEIIKYSFMLILDIAGIIFINIKTKKTELIGLVIVIIFILLNFIIPIIWIY